jgi:hypothetical protein
MSIYTELLAAGVPLDNHESDLYALVTPESAKILCKHNQRLRSFESPMDKAMWFDIPFAYDPFWEGMPVDALAYERRMQASKRRVDGARI